MKLNNKNTLDPNARFSVVYRIKISDSRTIEEIAEDITIEQTVETPLVCVAQHVFDEGILGHVENISTVSNLLKGEPKDVFDVTISFRCDATGFSIPQLLNLVFGNISLKNNIKMIGFNFPQSFLDHFHGPNFGIDGIRKLLGVWGRPLACTALKPMGLSVKELGFLAGAFALGGADMIKDDHGLGNQPFHPFNERVTRCAEAVAKANAATGGKTMYCPMVSGRFDEIERQVHHCIKEGLKGILMAPMLVGMDTMRFISETYPLAIIGHPSLTGTFFSNTNHGATPAVLLGTLFRMIGADISVFPNAGGRFLFTQKECDDLAQALSSSLGSMRAALPCPAGGMSFERIEELRNHYGNDIVLLIGGALLQLSPDKVANTKIFMEKIKAPQNPAHPFVS